MPGPDGGPRAVRSRSSGSRSKSPVSGELEEGGAREAESSGLLSSPLTERPGYRPDIDGLRAVAVLSVLLHHLHLLGATGGYVGVDVFFVISGYLITGIIQRGIGAGNFSFARFYERRARRILPALLPVVGLTMLVGAFVLLPVDLENLGRSTVAVALFVANVFFRWIQVDYFAPGPENFPLLHTWSLGVEEQFYLVWPLALVLLSKLGSSRIRIVLVLIISSSLAAAQLALVAGRPQAAFYLSQYRAWELALGALVAVLPRLRLGRVAAEALAIAGATLVLLPVFAYSPSTPFPGVAAVPPCAGTGLLLLAGGGGSASRVGRALSLPPLRYVGLISYSLYLWHWPLVSFYTYAFQRQPPVLDALLLALLSWLAAHLSWRFVELPFRVERPLLTRSRVFWTSAAGLAVVVVIGLWTVHSGGAPGRLSPDALRLSSYVRYESDRPETCFAWTFEQLPAPCRVGDVSGRADRKAVIWGDSHAEQLLPALDSAMKRSGIEGTPLLKHGCLPLWGVSQPLRELGLSGCDEFNEMVWSQIRSHGDLDLVVLAARWGRARGRNIVARDPRIAESADPQRQEVQRIGRMRQSLSLLVEQLRARGLEVVLVGPVPELAYEPTKCLAVSGLLGMDANRCRLDARAVAAALGPAAEALVAVAAESPGTSVVLLSDALCDESSCVVEVDDVPLYRDSNHLTSEGSALLAGLFAFSEPSGKPIDVEPSSSSSP